jgi:glycosyltransferase involved in cell wall biosynthesis
VTAISVVIPTFNRAHLIGETLASIFAQTLPAFEIIVVDDGSTDETPEILARLGNRVRTIRVANGGPLAARNVGLRAAQTGLVAFCDDDDLWMPHFLETMAAQWQARPDLVACYANFRILRDGMLSATSKFDDAPSEYWCELQRDEQGCGTFETPVVERLIAFQPFFPSALVVRRDAFLAAGGWDDAVNRRYVSGDFATALRLANLPPLGVTAEPLVAIRKHDRNISGDNQKMNLGEALVLEHVLQNRPELAPLDGTIRNSIARRRRDALGIAFWRRDFKAVADIYAMLPAELRGLKEFAKYLIAALPAPLSGIAAAMVSW